MKQSLRLALRVLTPVTCTQAGVPFTTSMGRIIETRAKITGAAPSWAACRRDLKAAAREGLIEILPAPPRPIRYDPFRSPSVLVWTEAGMADLELEPQIHLVPRLDEGPPAWLPKRDPAARNLPPKAKAIMDTLQGLQDCSSKDYVAPSVDWIREQCRKFHREPMFRSTFFAWAAWLDCYGFLRRATRKRQLKVDTKSKGKLLKAGAWINDTTLYYIAAKAWGWAKRAFDRYKKHLSHTEVRDSRHNTGSNLHNIGGGELSTDSSPPFLKIKEAAPPSVPSDRQSKPLLFNFNDLLSSISKQ